MTDSPNKGFRRRFWDILCDYDHLVKLVLAMSVLMMVMLALAARGISTDSSAFVVLVIDLVFLVPMFVLAIAALVRCNRRDPDDWF